MNHASTEKSTNSRAKQGPRRRGRWLLRILLALLIVLLVLGAMTYVALRQGVSVAAVDVGGVAVREFRLTLDRKLSLAIGSLTINPAERPQHGDEPQPPPDPRRLKRLLTLLHYGFMAFRDITLDDLRIGQLQGSFRYREHEPGYLTLSSDRSVVDLALDGDAQQLAIELRQLSLRERAIEASGQFSFDVDRRLLSGQLQGRIADTLPVAVDLKADREQLTFEGRGLDSVDSIAPIVDLFQLKPAISRWIVDYLVASEFSLAEISGVLPFDEPGAILQTLYARALAKDVAYTFAEGLEPARAAAAEVVFAQGVLSVNPEQTSWSGYDGSGTDVTIDFNEQRLPLTVNIRAQAPAADAVVTLLDHYGIPFPFQQVEGLTDIDLKLGIALAVVAQNVRAALAIDGHFVASDSVIGFGGALFDVAALDIELHDTTQLTFNRLDLVGPQGPALQLAGQLSGELDLVAKTGELLLAVERFQWPSQQPQLTLQGGADEPTVVALQFSPNGHTLSLPATLWQYGQRRVAVDAFATPFDLRTLSGRLPPTTVALGRELQAQVQGDFNAKAFTTDFQVLLTRLVAKGFRLAQQQAPLTLRVDKGVHLALSAPMKLDAKGVEVLLQPSRIHYAQGRLRIEQSAVQVGKLMSAALTGVFDSRTSSGQLALSDLTLRSGGGEATFFADSVVLKLSRSAAGLQMRSPELGLQLLVAADGGWTLDCPDLAKLHRYSSLLQRELLTRGSFHLASPAGADRYQFRGLVHYPYALLVEGDKPTGDFVFSGWHGRGRTQLTVNDAVTIGLGRSIIVESRGIGYNMAEMLRLARDAEAAAKKQAPPTQVATPASGDDTSEHNAPQGRRFSVRARDTFLWLDDKHRVLANRLTMQIADREVALNLQHGAGLAEMLLAGGKLQLAGKNFNDRFILALAPELGDLDKGSLEFRVDGTLHEINAVLAIRNTVIKDLKSLNNMLAFINTLPGVMTFKPPTYDKEGLPARELSVSLTFANRVMDMKSILIDSDELTVRGTGMLDFTDQTMAMTFNLISGMKKSLSSIPLLGFILEGDEEKTAIALKVSGDISNPEVKSTAFKEVAAYPFKVLARTLLLPVHLIKSAQGEADHSATGEAQ